MPFCAHSRMAFANRSRIASVPPGKAELNADLVEHKGHKVDVFLVEWHVLKDAIGRH